MRLRSGPISALLCALTVALCGCGSAAPEPAETPPAVPALSSEPTPTPTPMPALAPKPTLAPTPEPAPTPRPAREALDYAAEQVTPVAAALTEAQSAALTDGDYGTRLRLGAGETLTLGFPRPVTGLYLIWDAPPGAWSAAAEDWTAEYGAGGVIHEFAELPAETAELTLSVSQEAILCGVCGFTDGILPDWVQRWDPPAETADLLLFPTHGDDEHLFFGGTMPYYAGEMGKTVQVVYLMNHWDEQPRPHEQLDGLWTGGVRNYPVFGPFHDKYCADLFAAETLYGGENVARFQAEMIRRFRPLAVIGHDVNGEYGHGAHQLNARSLSRAAELAADAGFAPDAEYGVWELPKLYLHLWKENPIEMNWDVPLARFDGLTAFEVAKLGYARHTSQQHWSFHVYAREEWLSCYRFGLVRSTVGPDLRGDDFLENIPPREGLAARTP